MKREPTRLANEQFDLLVVGAGIYGSTIAAAAAEQGLKVALIDQGDFGHATSANSQKIIHGGLRYLQQLDLWRMRESIAARRHLMTVAPHLVRPLPCIVPTQGHGLRSKLVLAVALALNDLVSWDRNRAMDDAHRLPRGRVVSAAECLQRVPGLNPGDVTGGAVWFDAMAWDSERVTLAFVTSAASNGACVANYIQATGYLGTAKTVYGVAAKNVLDGETFEIRASVVVNAMGPWSGGLSAPNGEPVPDLPRRWCRAMNVIINRQLFGEYAVGLTAGQYVDRDAILNKGTRDFFFVPWRGCTIIGTFYDRVQNWDHKDLVGPEDIQRMLREINTAYPAADLKLTDVGYVHSGMLPEAPNSNEFHDVQLLKQPVVVDAAPAGGVQGLLSVIGVKYTTAAQVAQRIVHTTRGKLRRVSGSTGFDSNKRDRSNTGQPSIGVNRENAAATVQPDTVARLRATYGSALSDVWRFLETPESRQSLSPDQSILAGEVIYSVRREMSQKLSDVVFRRTGLGTDHYPGRRTLLRCAEVMAAEHGWTVQRMNKEIVEVEQKYSALFAAGCIERPEPLIEAASPKTAGNAHHGRE
ncbi:MAG: FAD-dependent oxidoreductase [Woeseiaceae bacterium]